MPDQEVDIAQLEAKIEQLAEEKRAAHEAVASCGYQLDTKRTFTFQTATEEDGDKGRAVKKGLQRGADAGFDSPPDCLREREVINMDIQECIKSGCEIVAIETFMSDEHQKLIDNSFIILKSYEKLIVDSALAFKDYCSPEEKALLAQKAIMNDKERQVILSKIEDMHNGFLKTRIIIKPTVK
jgi:hypothetical protein